jgi:hypothetical protein
MFWRWKDEHKWFRIVSIIELVVMDRRILIKELTHSLIIEIILTSSVRGLSSVQIHHFTGGTDEDEESFSSCFQTEVGLKVILHNVTYVWSGSELGWYLNQIAEETCKISVNGIYSIWFTSQVRIRRVTCMLSPSSCAVILVRLLPKTILLRVSW